MQPLRVLIVDDHPTFRAAARELLQERGHLVVAEVEHGDAAVDAVTRLSPDMVILDVGLGDESGFDVSRALVAARAGLAVVLVSARDRDVTGERLCECGARAFVLKEELPATDLAELWQGR